LIVRESSRRRGFVFDLFGVRAVAGVADEHCLVAALAEKGKGDLNRLHINAIEHREETRPRRCGRA